MNAGGSASDSAVDAAAVSVPMMAYVLQSATSTVDEQVSALRSLKQHLDADLDMDVYSKKRIKQIILDSVLKIILNEDRITNIVKRQLIRTELFIILAKLLNSDALFGSVLKHPSHSADDMSDMTSVITNAHSVGSKSDVTQPTMHAKPLKLSGLDSELAQHRGYNNNNDSDQLDNSTTTDSATTAMIDGMKMVSRSSSTPTIRRMKLLSRSGNSIASSSDRSVDISMLAPSIEQSVLRKKRYLRSKAWKARPTVLFSGTMQEDSIAPGSDPLNYLQQDIKLGYQKPRMWFPGGGSVASANTILPPDRSAKEAAGSDQIVREFLQMKALASYVGDLVAPFVPPTSRATYMNISSIGIRRKHADLASTAVADEGSVASTNSKFRLADVTDPNRFAQAMAEASAIWSPLLGLHLPPMHREKLLSGTRKRSSSAMDQEASSYVGPYRDLVSLPSKTLRTERGLSRSTRMGPLVERLSDRQKRTVASMRIPHLSDVEQYDSQSYVRRSVRYQQRVAKHLQIQREHVMASIRAMEALIAATIGLQYAQLHPNYLLLIEGPKAHQRELLAACMSIFCRVKRRNLLQLVLGIWKILLVVHASKARRPQYARVVSCHLMARWREEVHVKKLRLWIVKWRRGVSLLIFLERYRRVVVLQTLYRTWRDRRKLVRMHLVKPYLGVLSDIDLAPTRREVLFAIPDIIRSERRVIWAAAKRIQTKFRSWIASRDYFHRIRMLILIQSVCRMFPIYRKFRRLRATTIQCQAWSRRTVKVKQYRRLKRCTIIVQKYVRRYLSTLWKWRQWNRAWAIEGLPIAAAITIQCRWRIHIARKAKREKLFRKRLLVYSAMVIQRSYFRYRRAFHTFFLVCALSQREKEDLMLERLATSMGKARASRTIVRFYRQRFQRRIVVFVLKVQSWYRGRLAHFYVTAKRRERWACRKLRHWMRCTVLRRHRYARMIQRRWWAHKQGRLMRHLWMRAARSDEEAVRAMEEQQYWAAVRMQAIVKGVWDRRYVCRLRAALVIQKYARFYFGLKRWRRWKLYQIRRKVTSFLDKMFKKVLRRRTEDVCELHSLMLRKPQACIRGYLIRAVFRRATEVAYRMGMAALRIQRCWRAARVVSKAVEEKRALRRRHDNPFQHCRSPHEVLLETIKLCSNCYSASDARVGLKLSGFLHRLGLMELLEAFPKKRFALASDLRSLSADKMAELYTTWRSKVDHAKSKKVDHAKRLNDKPPLDKLQLISDLARLPYPPTTSAARERLRALQAVPEYLSPAAAAEMIRAAFAKKFGKNLVLRADKVAAEMLEAAYGQFNNYRTVGVVFTRPLMLQAIARSSDPNAVMETWTRVLQERQGVAEERRWDRQRTAKSSEILQYAVDQLDAMLPYGPLRDLITTANDHMMFYRRKMKLVTGRTTTSSKGRPGEALSVESVVRSNLSGDSADVPPTVYSSLGLHYLGSQLEDLELELHVSQCKVYEAAVEPLYLLSCAVQRLKRAWKGKALRRSKRAEAMAMFLTKTTMLYKQDRQLNKVKHLWERNRRLEKMQKRVALIVAAVRERKRLIEYSLSFVPRAGWVAEEDHFGHTYWLVDDPKAPYEPVHQMPMYSYLQWLKVLKIQAVAREYLKKLAALRLKRLEEEQLELARIAAALEEERRNDRKMLSARCMVYTASHAVEGKDPSPAAGRGKTIKPGGAAGMIEEPPHHQASSVEPFLPWNLRFDQSFRLRHGAWVLFQSAPRDGPPVFEVAVMFRLVEQEGVCDVRNVKGQCFRRVKLWRIFQMTLDVGTRVETRYQHRKLFYRSRIIRIDTHSDIEPVYTVKYDDGEVEGGLRRDAIRPSLEALRLFLQARKQLLPDAMQRRDRYDHFARMRRRRMMQSRVQSVATNRPPAVLAIEDGSLEEKASEGGVLALIPDSSLTVADDQSHPSIAAGRTFLKIRLRYSRSTLMFGWEAVAFPEDDPTSFSSEPAGYFIHNSTNEISEEAPLYAPLHVQSAQRIQLAWLSFQARRRVKHVARSFDLMELVLGSIREASKQAFIGYALEGVTALQILCRAGYWELADAIESHYKSTKQNLQSLTIEEVARTAKDDCEKLLLGAGQPPTMVKALKDFQTWWGRVTTDDKQKRLSFFNYYTGPDDPRSIQDCIRESEEVLVKKFTRVLKTGASRTRAAVQTVVEAALFPHTHQQVDAYLKKYGDKPEMARDCVHELINKTTTHTWLEEKMALKTFRNTTRLVKAVLGTLRLEGLHRSVCRASQRADQLLVKLATPLTVMGDKDKGAKRVACSGPEAKAALLLRVEVLELVRSYVLAVVRVQKHVRGSTLRRRWLVRVQRRIKALSTLQCWFRVVLALNQTRALMEQMTSEWEQLWDGRRNLLYYYNRVTGTSQYEEPPCPFRPLIRDYYSSQLVQAWPQLDRAIQQQEGSHSRLPGWTGSSVSSATVSASSLCGVCAVRRTVRLCYDCEDEHDPSKHHAYPYCFPCYMKRHTDDDDERDNHQFQVVAGTGPADSVVDEWSVDNSTLAGSVDSVSQLTSAVQQPSSSYLQCCMCDRAATRKCLGILDETQLEAIVNSLRRSDPARWMEVLVAANIGGERKLMLLLEQFRLEHVAIAAAKAKSLHPKKKPVEEGVAERGDEVEGRRPPQSTPTVSAHPDVAFLTMKNLQSVRSVLEGMRAECDECYCAEHYAEVHAGGKRALHRWQGFCEHAAVCSVCTNSPAELSCEECNQGLYCASCYQVFHGMGRKRLHRKQKVLEELGDQQDYCYVCQRRPVQVSCDNFSCRVMACDSCYLFQHKPQCDRDMKLFSPSSRKASIKMTNNASPYRPSSPQSPLIDIGPEQCVVCGEGATRRCVVCGDLYCGKATTATTVGCFHRHHAKGNRAAHTTEPFFGTAFLSRRAFERKRSVAQSTMSSKA